MNGFLRCLNSASPSSPFKNLPKILLLILLLNLLLCFFHFYLYPVMEPSQIFGVSEDCHSSESGWTMYIGSPIDGSSDADTDEDVEEEEQEEAKKNKAFYANHQDDSDDSMASDASSGPSHQQRHHFGENGRMKNPNGFKNEVSFCLESKTKKPLMEKQRGAERKEVKEKLVLVGQKPKSSVQSSSKVRKSIWMGKRN